MTLRQVQEAVQLASGLQPSRQRVLVLEERGDILQPRPTLGSLAKAAAQSLAHRPSAKAALVGGSSTREWVLLRQPSIPPVWKRRGGFARMHASASCMLPDNRTKCALQPHRARHTLRFCCFRTES